MLAELFPGYSDSSVVSPAAALVEPPGLLPQQLWGVWLREGGAAGLRQGRKHTGTARGIFCLNVGSAIPILMKQT